MDGNQALGPGGPRKHFVSCFSCCFQSLYKANQCNFLLFWWGNWGREEQEWEGSHLCCIYSPKMGIATCFALAWCFGHLFNNTFKHTLNDTHGNSSLTVSSFQSITNTSLWTQTAGLCPLMPTHWNHPSCQPGHSWCQHLACKTCLIIRDAEGGAKTHLNGEEVVVVGLQERETSLFDRWLLDAVGLKKNSWTSRWAQKNHTETAQGHKANTFIQQCNDPC